MIEKPCHFCLELNDASAQSVYAGRWWTMLPEGRIECRLLSAVCKLNEGQRGFCFVRQRVGEPQEETPGVKDIAVVPFACRSLTFDGELFWSISRKGQDHLVRRASVIHIPSSR